MTEPFRFTPPRIFDPAKFLSMGKRFLLQIPIDDDNDDGDNVDNDNVEDDEDDDAKKSTLPAPIVSQIL